VAITHRSNLTSQTSVALHARIEWIARYRCCTLQAIRPLD